LEDPDRLGEVLDPVLAEIDHVDVDLVACRLRQQNLAAVSRSGDTCSEVDVETHIPLVRQLGGPSVEAHPNADRTIRQRSLGLCRRRHRLGRILERDEERVALRIDLDAAVALERVAHYAPVPRERLRVAASELV
jgi:hypothetical protein